MPKSGDDIPPLVRAAAFVGDGFAAVDGAAVEVAWVVAEGASVTVEGAVGAAVSEGGGTGLGASGGVTVAIGASVEGAAGRGVLVGVGVGPEVAGEHALSTSPATKTSNKSGQRKPGLREASSFRMVIVLPSA